MPREHWETETSAGYTHNILYQGEEADCGLCCCAMVINLKDGSRPTSKSIQTRLPKGHYIKARNDRAGHCATPFAIAAPLASVNAGTLLEGISLALTAFGIRNTKYGGSGLKQALRNARQENPVIVQVQWKDGGGYHWVVIGRSMGKAQLVLDPAYGMHINQNTDTYTGFAGGAKTEYGTWMQEWLTVD
ncbi:MAG: hypothetical protein KUG77_00685 [Nannocystaceae bacterium]|nr:hypothetical protein [Nannocystaceae bacterium]